MCEKPRRGCNDPRSFFSLGCSVTSWPRNWPWRCAAQWKERNEDELTDVRRERKRETEDSRQRWWRRRRTGRESTRERKREKESASLEPRCGTKDETLKISAQKSPRHGATGLMAVRRAKSFGGDSRSSPTRVQWRLEPEIGQNRFSFYVSEKITLVILRSFLLKYL